METISLLSDSTKDLVSIFAFLGVCWTVFCFIKRQHEQDAEIKQVQIEQAILCEGVLACLSGLHQLGANGEVTKAHERLSKHLNVAAHHNE